MQVFPGTESPLLRPSNTIAQDGFAEMAIMMSSHTGTHIDAPAHMLTDGITLDQFPIEQFIGKALLVDFADRDPKPIEVGDLLPLAGLLADNIEFVILKTGWSTYWDAPHYFEGYPYLTEEAATWLSHLSIKGIGIDAISIDATDSETFSVHKILMRNNILIIENLTNLAALNVKQFLFAVLPLKTQNADGAPARAIAIID